MASLDITSLFTNVPIEDVLNFLESKIDSNQISLPIPKTCFLELIKLCTNHNYFQFNEKFYRQKFGISMGSPLSPVLANLFMEYFESQLLPSITPKPLMWLRYVDDVFLIWPENENFDVFYQKVNDLVPSIKFTTEWENNRNLPFLDTRVHRMISGFSFAIYRKPTHSNQYIHYFSWHTEQVKRSALFSLLLRAYRICDHPYLQLEIDFIYAAFQKTGFPIHVIEEVHCKVVRKFNNSSRPTVDDENRQPRLPLPHNSFVSGFINPLLRAYDCKVVNKTSRTIRTRLVHNRPQSSDDPSKLPGVYSIPCQDCPQKYYGETGRPFSERLKEHKAAVRNKNWNYSAYRHVRSKNHNLNWEEAKIIYPSYNYYDRLVIEASCIKTQENFNHKNSTLAIDQLSANLILKSNSNISRKILN